MTPPIYANLLIFSGMPVTDPLFMPTIHRLREAGADGVEVPIFGPDLSIPAFENLGANLRRVGTGVSAVSAALPECDPSSPDKMIRERGIEGMQKIICCAEALGARVLCGPLVVPWGWRLPSMKDVQELHIQLKERLKIGAESFQQLAEYAAARKVKLALEYLTRWEIGGPTTLRQILELLTVINRPNVGVLVDIAHEVLDGEGPKVFEELMVQLAAKDLLTHVHVSPPHRGDFENSWLPWAQFFRVLKKLGWNQPLVLEAFDAVDPFLNGVRLTRPRFPDPIEVIAGGIGRARYEWKEVEAEAALSKPAPTEM